MHSLPQLGPNFQSQSQQQYQPQSSLIKIEHDLGI
jgi:hypothetical protein